MKKNVLTFIISAGLVSTLIVPQLAGAASSATQRIEQELNQLRKGLADNQKKAAESKSAIDKIAQEKQAVTKDLNTLLAEIVTANLKLNDLNNQISAGKEKLAVNGKELEEVEERIDSRDKLLKSRLRLMYMNGVVSYADVLLSSTSFGDFLDRLNALNAIVNQDKHILEDNRKDRTEKEGKEKQIKQELSQVGDLYTQQAVHKSDLDNKEKEKQVMIASLSQKEKEEKHTLEDISEDSEKNWLKRHASSRRSLKRSAKMLRLLRQPRRLKPKQRQAIAPPLATALLLLRQHHSQEVNLLIH